MKSMYLLAIQLITLLFGSAVFSQNVDSTQIQLDKKVAKAITNEKGEVVFVFYDGREAQVFYGPSGSFTGQVKLQQLENSCEYDFKPANCEVEGFYQNFKFQMQWTKHSDPQKIGRVVERVYSSEIERFEEDLLISNLTYHKTFDDKPNDYPKYKISCDQTQWIEKAQTSAKSALFSSVTSEFMLENSETGVNENQTFAEIYNARFDAVSLNSYILSTYQYSRSIVSSGDPFLSNQVVHFVYPEKNKACHIAFAANISDLAMKANELEEKSKEIINKKILKNVGNFSNNEFNFLIEELLRKEKDNAAGGGYQ